MSEPLPLETQKKSHQDRLIPTLELNSISITAATTAILFPAPQPQVSCPLTAPRINPRLGGSYLDSAC